MTRLKIVCTSTLVLLAASFSSCGHSSSASRRVSAPRQLIAIISPDLRREVLSSSRTREEVANLNAYYDNRISRYFNGAILVARKGVIIFEKYRGFANLVTQEPVTEHTTFQLASTSKPFTAMAILWLWQQRRLHLTDSIQQFIPGFPYHGITLKSLLSHRSGLPNYLYFSDSLWSERSRLMSNQDVVNLMISHHPAADYPPDRHFKYCNTNYCLLALVAEKVSGKSLGKLLDSIFFRPLGMTDTWLFDPLSEVLRPRQSLSYDYRGRMTAPVPADGVIGDKNIYSTPRDLLKWDQALYNGNLFNSATLKAAFTPYSNEHRGIRNYGLGWRLLVYPDGEKVIYHNGWWHGNNSVFYRFVRDSTTLIMLCNRYDRGIYQVQPIWKILHESPGVEDSGEE
jgi:CubicO group peptidase (beta-lactamase class C family)